MLQIEIIKETKHKNVFKTLVEGHVIVNSIEDKDSYYFEYASGYNSVSIDNEDVIVELLKYSFAEVGTFIDTFSYDIDFEKWGFLLNITFNCNENVNEIVPALKAEFRVEIEEWNKPYTIFEFSKELSKTIETDNNANYEYFQLDDEFASNGFGIFIKYSDFNTSINEVEESSIELIKDIIDRTISALVSNLDKDGISSYFTFPENIKTSCKQYLIYFAQFLTDIGIEADTEIKEEAHRTLFKVIPKDNNESLDNIKEALLLYLSAPSFDSAFLQNQINQDIAVMQWDTNIFHLKTQLTLANSILQLKDATIQSLQLSNFQYQHLLQDKENIKESDKEEDIIEGIVSLKKYEGEGFSVNFAEILRRLKRRLK